MNAFCGRIVRQPVLIGWNVGGLLLLPDSIHMRVRLSLARKLNSNCSLFRFQNLVGLLLGDPPRVIQKVGAVWRGTFRGDLPWKEERRNEILVVRGK
ncbi:hypothetical protein AVEN_228146-1 [Araneus ventricosus]|uniref:Uncharacterized protein n=1 Tax=Araneus ventricosus TaxID=182803 RepID=A0A4Y2CTF8_ARAVE|nr:hypothetical protein AVEN_228146-1 [Araneus ventricosus]